MTTPDDTAFIAALHKTLAFEGGFVDNPADHGGATNFGITQRVYDAYLTGKGRPTATVQTIQPEEVREIYFDNYWLASKCDQLPSIIAAVHFDTAVNCGVTQANKFLQRAVGVAADGIIGPGTLGTVHNQTDILGVVSKYASERAEFYIDLAIKNPSQIQFLNGWISRIISLL
jgi:lysozyme family protein